MRYFLVLLLSMGLSISMTAQKSNLVKVKKLIGRADKLEEARGLLKAAMDSTETKDDIDTYYLAGKVEWAAYDRNSKANRVTPNAVNQIEVAKQLLNGYRYFDKVIAMDTLKNSKGVVKQKYTKDLKKRIASHIPDIDYAASVFFNDPNKQNYENAYEAYMIYADTPYRTSRNTLPDTVKSKIYLTAGRAAWNSENYENAASAFDKSRRIATSDPMAWIYEIASWHQIGQKDQSREDAAKNAIMETAADGVEKFGLSNPYILDNLINTMMYCGKGEDAVEFLTGKIQENPDMAALYGLRGFVYDYLKKDDLSEQDYRKYATMPNVSNDMMRNAINKLVSIGTKKWNLLEIKDPQLASKKSAIKNDYFIEAKKWIERMNGNGAHPGDFNDLLGIIYYHINQ